MAGKEIPVVENYSIPRAGRKRSSMDFERLIQDGTNDGVPGGFTAQTVNGTATWRGTGWNRSMEIGRMPAPEGGAWQGGRSNRTGE